MSDAAGPPPAPPRLVVLHVLAALTLGMTQGLGNQFVSANAVTVQGHFLVTANEAAWLPAAYTATSITATLLLYKVRNQYGLRLFAEAGLAIFASLALLHLAIADYRLMVALRAAAGFAAAPLSTLAFLYTIQVMAPQHRLSVGLSIGVLGSQLAAPVARLIAPPLLDHAGWEGLVAMEAGLALVSLAIVMHLPLAPNPRAKVFDPIDAVSFPMLMLGVGLLSLVLGLGRLYWWLEADWLGLCLAASVVLLCAVAALELNRKRAMLDLRWMMQPQMILFAGVMLCARALMAEPTSATVAFLQTMGLQNDQLAGLELRILLTILAGTVVSCFIVAPQRAPAIHAVSFALIALGAWLESFATSQSRAPDFYLPQMLIAFGSALFVPSAMAWGLGWVMRTAPQHLMSFLAVFLGANVLGSQIGSALFGTLLVVREKFHSAHIVEPLALSNPLLAQRVQQYGAAYRAVIEDPLLRQAQGLRQLGTLATREAYARAHDDVFLTVAALALAMLAILGLHAAIRGLRLRTAPLPA